MAASLRREELWTLRTGGIPSWLISLGSHAALLTVLAFLYFDLPSKASELTMESEVIEIPEAPVIPLDIEPAPLAETPQVLDTPVDQPTNVPSVAAAAPAGDGGATATDTDTPTVGMSANAAIEGLAAANLPVGKARTEGFGARGTGKAVAIATGKGTLATEFAVTTGLDWMVSHQVQDGSWHLDHSQRSKGPTTGIGETRSHMAATALALLPFLAANHTHKTGGHKATVKKGLQWMIANQQASGLLAAKDDQQPMYTHGLATIVLCEAYGLTKDPVFQAYAQKAIDFTVKCQNKEGAWRYAPTSPDSDTSVFGWMFMSLKSAKMAGLRVEQKAFDNAMKYLKTAAVDKQLGLFAYQAGGPATPAMSAIGLLCHQYMGKGRNDELIKKGVEHLVKVFPPEKQGQPYYWYYSTQVVHHYQGAEWDRWNRAMRKIWVEKQNRDKESPDFGSWDPRDFNKNEHDLKSGGRHYLTAIGLLTLEVYYRYLPLYEASADSKMASAN